MSKYDTVQFLFRTLETFQLIYQQRGIATIVGTVYNIMHVIIHNIHQIVTHFCICSSAFLFFTDSKVESS